MGSKGSAKLIVIGKTMYLNPDDKYWEAGLGSAAAAAALHLVNGRYIKTTTSGGILAQLCDLSHSRAAGQRRGRGPRGRLVVKA